MKQRVHSVRPHFVKVLAKSFDLLEAMAESKTGISVSQLSRIVGQPKPSVFRILYTLKELGYVEQEADSQCYALSERLRSLSSGTAFEVLRRIARPYMESLVARFEQTVSLGVHRHGQVLYLEIVEGLRSIRMSAVVNSYAPIYSTALGKAILAFVSRDGAKHLLDRHALSKFTPRTMTNIQTLLTHLDGVAHQGYAVDDQETEMGARCVAAPIFNVEAKPFAAISISGPVSHIQGERIPEIAKAIKTACQKISAQMGFSSAEAKVRGAGLNWLPQFGKRLP